MLAFRYDQLSTLGYMHAFPGLRPRRGRCRICGVSVGRSHQVCSGCHGLWATWRGRIATWVRLAVLSGELVKPASCEGCGESPPWGFSGLNAHHPDYRYPLRVEWLCPACHCRAHRQGSRP